MGKYLLKRSVIIYTLVMRKLNISAVCTVYHCRRHDHSV